MSAVATEDGENGRLSRLPPGRHGLPREFVVQNQRERLAAGAIASVAERGFHKTTVTHIAEAAKMSRRTFYGYFPSKEECFFDTFGVLEEFLREAMAEVGGPKESWPRRVRGRTEVLLGTFAANPDLVRFSLVAPPSAGGEFADRYREFLHHLVDWLTEGLPDSRGYREPSAGARDALAGSIAALVIGKVEAGDGEEMEKLTPEVAEAILAPFIGRKRASTEARR